MQIGDSNDIRPSWKFVCSNLTQNLVPIQIRIRDRDGGLRFGDDSVDISPRRGATDLEIFYNLRTNQISGDVSGSGGRWLVSRGYSDGDGSASIWFRIDRVRFN